MTDLGDLWASEHARYDESVFRARETIERYWPFKGAPRIVDVKGYLGDFLVLVEGEPFPGYVWRALHMLSGHMLHHEPRRLVRMAAEEIGQRYEQDRKAGPRPGP